MSEKMATRAAYGKTLIELVEEGYEVVAVDADLSGSTTTAALGNVYPERLINVGIAEQNMIGVAAGLSLANKIVFTGSFAVFGTGRVYDQIRNTVCYANLNVKIAPTHAGISVGPDGGSHQMVEDIALMRVLPNMRVLVPADYSSAKYAIKLAASTPGPVYIRMGRCAVDAIYDTESLVFVDGVDAHSNCLAFGKANVLRIGTDATIVACGMEVAHALSAAEKLEKQGISVEVIDAFSIKPLDVDTILASAQKTGVIITAEEHSIIGGLGSAVAEVLAENLGASSVSLIRIGIKDCFGTSGEAEELFAEYKIDAQAISEAVLSVV